MTLDSATHTIEYPTRFGNGWVAFSGDQIVATGLPGSSPQHPLTESPPAAAAALAAELTLYWNGGPLPAPPDDVMASAARTDLVMRIYEKVVSIPPGSTMTYAAVAESVGRPGAARAVGAAMAANRFAPIIPCHRVVGSDGSLRGYAGGLEMKRALLAMEKAGNAS